MNHRGQALIIFVVLLPVFLLIMSGITEIGHMLYSRKELVINANYCQKINQSNCWQKHQLSYDPKSKTASKELTGIIYKYKLTIKYQYQE